MPMYRVLASREVCVIQLAHRDVEAANEEEAQEGMWDGPFDWRMGRITSVDMPELSVVPLPDLPVKS